MEKITINNIDLDYFVKKIERGEPFSVSRFGDGEWLCILGTQGRNCDGHEYFPALRDELRRILESKPEYFLGIQKGVMRNPGEIQVIKFLSERNLEFNWFDADIFQRANWEGEFNLFINVVRKRKALFVGPPHLEKAVSGIFPGAAFLEIPPLNCFLAADQIEAAARQVIERQGSEIVLFSAGMTANILVDRLYRDWGQRLTLLDIGSVWDIYGGKKSREHFWAEIFDWPEIIARNLRPSEET